ncbi:hypothetical protein Bpfe_002237 [Biomphalaria pfeifferi]|uniref:Uncharacterized protein n=1 Tax=Biomphalaria pfeifferi TaxID=112525 RepID=A0AAD8FL06_BIOPF|nr:hypothetical protein Bpfe_002130 [Biomphalaria pfeifferi]KAK0068302.1 hypothetical protein Bpfe_002237 [Biomphalaria pfeifferi]
MGSQDPVKDPYCLWPHILLPKVMGSQDSVTEHLATHFPYPRSWAVKSLSLVRTVYGDTLSSPDIMGSQNSVIGP